MFFPGYEFVDKPVFEQFESQSFLRKIVAETPVRCTHFVAFAGKENISAACAYLEAMLTREPGSPEGGPMHVDGAYSWYRNAYNKQTYIPSVELGYQRASQTDVHDLGWKDRFIGIRDVVSLIRKLKNILHA